MTERPTPAWRGAALAGALVVVVGLVLRVRLLASPVGRLDSDESIVALMGARIHDGSHPLFFWGQYYGGTIEVYLVSVLQLVRRGVVAVKLVPLLLSLVAGWLTTRAARHVVDDRRALLAGALVAGWPGTVWLATKERGFYWMDLVLVVGALVVALRIHDAAEPARVDAALLGALAGLAWYETAQSAFVLGPLLAWLLVAHRATLRRLLAPVVGGFAVGVAPWLWGIVRHGGLVFRQPGPQSSYAERLNAVVRETIPRALGLRATYYGGLLLGPLGFVVAALALAAVAVAIVRVLRSRGASAWTPFAWIVLGFPFLAAIPKATAFSFEPRYGLLIVPIAAIALAALARFRVATAVVVALALAFGISNTHYVLRFSDDHPTALDLTPPDVRPLRGLLTAIRTTRVYADYWLAYPLTESSHESIVASPVDAPRSAYHQLVVQLAQARLWVLFAGSPRDRRLPAQLAQRGIGFRRSTARGFAFYVLDRWHDPAELSRFWSTVPAGYG